MLAASRKSRGRTATSTPGHLRALPTLAPARRTRARAVGRRSAVHLESAAGPCGPGWSCVAWRRAKSPPDRRASRDGRGSQHKARCHGTRRAVGLKPARAGCTRQRGGAAQSRTGH
eukprot:scaffold19114_cov118-Isochrysis_galbana.AAC.8